MADLNLAAPPAFARAGPSGPPDPTRPESREGKLAAFLAEVGARAMVWGEDDCCLMLANWAVRLGHPDPAAHLRGRYRTELGCVRVLARAGGVLAVVGDCARRIGLEPTERPRRGDVGVVMAETAHGVRAAGGLCLGRRWATRSDGLVVAEWPVVAAWRL